MPHLLNDHAKPERPRDLWWALGLACVFFLVRILYFATLSPYGLEADEAQYWEWSRRLDLSYYSKGPGIAWAIAASTRLLGDTVFAVKLPAAVAALLLMVAAAACGRVMAGAVRGRNPKPSLHAALAVGLLPGFVGTAMFTTTDGFYIAGWLGAVAAVASATRSDPKTTVRRRLLHWFLAGALLGVAALFKYTALFLVPGVLLFAVLRPRKADEPQPTWLGLALAGATTVICLSPVLVWNHRNGWPTVAHQLGRIGLPGGDEPVEHTFSIWHGIEFFGAQAALLGIVGIPLVAIAVRWAWRARRRDPKRDSGPLLLFCSAAPILAFFGCTAVLVRVQGNWALAGYTSLLVLVGLLAAEHMPAHAARVAAWKQLPRPRPRHGLILRKPESPFQILWHAHLAIGLGVATVFFLGPVLLRAPGVRDLPFALAVADRVSGHDAWIDPVVSVLAEQKAAGRDPLIVCGRYQQASLLAFFLPDQPRTYSAVSALGGRRSPYDFFADTRLDAPQLRGRDVLLVGSTLPRWSKALDFRAIETLRDADPPLHLARGFGGPKATPAPSLEALP